jgi:PilZ domain-containing protein
MSLENTLDFGHQLRRLVPRQRTDWRGLYKLEGDLRERWRECLFVDVSSTGAGLVLKDVTREEAEGRHIHLAIQLQAVVKNLTEDRAGLRAGTQFVGLSDVEQEYLLSLARSGGRW